MKQAIAVLIKMHSALIGFHKGQNVIINGILFNEHGGGFYQGGLYPGGLISWGVITGGLISWGAYIRGAIIGCMFEGAG